MTRLVVCPLSGLAAQMARHSPSHVVSLLSPSADLPSLPGVDHLRLTFHDIAEPRPDLVAPSAATVAELLAFTARWDHERPLLLHCYAGVSRSTAAAFILACALRPDVDEAVLADALRTLSPSATPNPMLIKLADEALGRQGRMRAAIRAIGRGAEAFEGECFAWDQDVPQ